MTIHGTKLRVTGNQGRPWSTDFGIIVQGSAKFWCNTQVNPLDHT